MIMNFDTYKRLTELAEAGQLTEADLHNNLAEEEDEWSWQGMEIPISTTARWITENPELFLQVPLDHEQFLLELFYEHESFGHYLLLTPELLVHCSEHHELIRLLALDHAQNNCWVNNVARSGLLSQELLLQIVTEWLKKDDKGWERFKHNLDWWRHFTPEQYQELLRVYARRDPWRLFAEGSAITVHLGRWQWTRNHPDLNPAVHCPSSGKLFQTGWATPICQEIFQLALEQLPKTDPPNRCRHRALELIYELRLNQRVELCLNLSWVHLTLCVNNLRRMGPNHPQSEAVLKRVLDYMTSKYAPKIYRRLLTIGVHYETNWFLDSWFHEFIRNRIQELGWVFVKVEERRHRGRINREAVIRQSGRKIVWVHQDYTHKVFVKEGDEVMVPRDPGDQRPLFIAGNGYVTGYLACLQPVKPL